MISTSGASNARIRYNSSDSLWGKKFDGLISQTPTYPWQEVDADELKDILRDLIRASQQSFQRLKAGAGERAEEHVIYPSSLSVPGASKTSIWIPIGEGRAYLSALIFIGEGKARAEKIYSDYVSKLEAAFPSGSGRETESSNAPYGGKLYSFQPNFGGIGAVVAISFRCRSSDICQVSLTVEAPEGAQSPKTVEEVVELPKKSVDIQASAREVIDKLAATDYEGARTYFNDQMKARSPVQELGQMWTSVVQFLGSYQGQDSPRTKKIQGRDVITIKCRMERGYVDLQIVFDEEGKVAGLWVLPAEGASPKRSDQELENLKRTAQDYVDKLIALDFENAGSNFNEQLKLILPVPKLRADWAVILQQHGAVKSQNQPQLEKRYGYDVVTIRCEMERGILTIDVTFDDEAKIGGVWIHPVI